jgi:hypothetical protein
MTANEKTITTLGKALTYIKKLPTGTYFQFAWDGGLYVEASTQDDVKKIRSCFRGVIWKKKYEEWAQRWTYTATMRTGVNIRITGCKEGPPSCKMVEETVMEEREVPLGYVKKMVEVKKVRYICPDSEKVEITS